MLEVENDLWRSASSMYLLETVLFTQGFHPSNTEDSDTSLGNLLLCSTSHSHMKKHFIMFRWHTNVLCICMGKILLSFCFPGWTVLALSASPCISDASKSQWSFAGLAPICHDFYIGELWDRPSSPEAQQSRM